MSLCRHAPLLALALLTSACSGIKAVPTPDVVAAIAPDDAPAPPQEPPRKGAEAMNTEYCLGSCAEEARRFQTFAEQIQALQKKQTGERKQPVARGFHAKAHGCLYGTMTALPDADPRTRFGVFAPGRGPWPVWVRFSNGVGWRQADDELDARGMAVKLMGVEGPRLTHHEQATQDFLMTNSPTPVGRNAEEFMVFAHANEKGRVSGLWFAARHPRSAAPALTRTSAIDSAATEQYWSGGAYHWGAHQAVKYTAKPCKGTPEREGADKDHPDYLQKDLAQAAKDGMCFTFYVQFQTDPEDTPIEHASVEWEEDDSPLIPVATIEMPAQNIGGEERAKFCDSLAYNPWHGIQAHQPMGHINRARRFVYDASRAGRKGGFEPTNFLGFDGKPVPAPAAELPTQTAPAETAPDATTPDATAPAPPAQVAPAGDVGASPSDGATPSAAAPGTRG